MCAFRGHSCAAAGLVRPPTESFLQRKGTNRLPPGTATVAVVVFTLRIQLLLPAGKMHNHHSLTYYTGRPRRGGVPIGTCFLSAMLHLTTLTKTPRTDDPEMAGIPIGTLTDWGDLHFGSFPYLF